MTSSFKRNISKPPRVRQNISNPPLIERTTVSSSNYSSPILNSDTQKHTAIERFKPYHTGNIIANLRIHTSPFDAELRVSMFDDTTRKGVEDYRYTKRSLHEALLNFTNDLVNSHNI